MNAGSSMSGTAARERKWQGANSAAPSDRMPRNVRSVVLLALLGLLAGAGLIVVLRGPAILIDLAAMASRWLCL